MQYIPKASVADQLNLNKSVKRSIDRQNILKKEDIDALDEIQAFIAYVEGSPVEEISEEFRINKDTFQYNLGKIKKHGVAGILDRRQSNGSYQEKKITKEIGQRILELRIYNPSLSTRDISDKLREQDNLEVSHTLVNEYINEIGLSDYRGTPFRDALFPPKEKNIELINSRYAGELMLIPAANKLGCMKAAEVLDVAKEGDHYSNDLIYRANFLSIASGKGRLSHVDELVESEFIEVCGGNFPKKSTNHAYLDRIIEKDIELVINGSESIIDKFVAESTKGYCEAKIIVAENLYMDKHVVQVNTEKNVGKDMHGTKDMIVKAVCEYWLVCADTKNPVYLKLYNAGEEAFSKIIKPILNKIKGLTGKNVQLLGLDRGAYNYDELNKATDDGETCIAIWGKDTPAMLKSLSELSNDIFTPYETVEEEDEEKNKVIKVKSTIADAGEIIVDNDGNKVRAVVIQNEESKRRIAILVFGKRAFEYSKECIADFMYGKQDIENHFKERKKWGSDKFCGGKITPKKLEPPTEQQLCKIGKRIIKIGQTLLSLKSKLSEYNELLSEKKVVKSDYNQLVSRLNRREKKLKKEEKVLNLRIGNNKNGQVSKEAPVYEIDMRKMTILAQLQDHVIVSRKYIMNIFIGFIIMLLSRNFEKSGKYTNEEITQKVNRYRNNINIQKLSIKLFEQGGGVYRDNINQKYIVVMRNYPSLIMQEAYKLLCQELLKLYTEIKVGGQGYQLLFMTEKNFCEYTTVLENENKGSITI